MHVSNTVKQKVKKVCTLLVGFSIIFLGLVFCVRVPPPYSYSFRVSSGQCQGNNATPVAGEQTLDIAAFNGSNITICMLRASDGTLLRHYDIPIHGDIMGQGDGFLYILERSGQQGDASAVCAIRIRNGLERWCQTQLKHYNMDNASNQIQTGNGSLYLRYAYQGESFLTAVNEQTGQVRWNVRTLQPIVPSNYLPATFDYEILALTQDIAYVNASQILPADQSTPATTSRTNGVCALRTSTGQQLWCTSFSPTELLINGMTAAENTLYVQTFQPASLYALNAANGSIRWQKSFTQVQPSNPLSLPNIPSSLVLTHGMVLVKTPNVQIYALRASDGQQIWNTPLNLSSSVDSLGTTQAFMYAITNARTGIHMFNILDGTPLWSYTIPSQPYYSTPNSQISDFMIEQDTVYLFQRSGLSPHMIALNTRDGTPRWEGQICTALPSGSSITPTPTPDNETHIPCLWQAPDESRFGDLQFLQVDVDQ